MERVPMIKRLLAMDLTFRAMVQDGDCVSADEGRILRAAPRYVVAVPEWGMGEGILIFAHSKAEADLVLAQHTADHAAVLYDLSTGESRSVLPGR